MRVSPEIAYRGVNKTPALETLIAEKIQKLELFYTQISSCHLVVEKVHDHPGSGSPYRVRIDITVPEDREIVVVKNPDKGTQYPSLEAVIRAAFDVANRQLKEMNEQQHNHKHTHVPGKREVMLDELEKDVAIQSPEADVTAAE